MITINQLHMAYGGKLLFYNTNLTLLTQKRYAIVGANGAGKSTLLKLLTGEEEPIDGQISRPKDITIGWLKQDQFRYENTPILDVVLQGKPSLWEALKEKESLLSINHWDEKIAHRFSIVEDKIMANKGYGAASFAQKILIGLGLPLPNHHQPLNALSGGYKLRVLLAQTLFQEPDILLLDEPTNHLDIISIEWLEKYLKNEFKGLVAFISHDIQFINHLADYILDIDYGEIRQYNGNYHHFLLEKQQIVEQMLHLKKNVEQKLSEMQKFVDRYRANASRAKQAQSRLKMMDKIEMPDIKHSSRLTPVFNFLPKSFSSKLILRVKNLSKQYQEKLLFSNLNFELLRSQKIAIIGENGVGKSTLLKILLGIVSQDAGDYEWASEMKLSYFSQDHHDLLNTKMSMLDWLRQHVSNISEQQARKELGHLLFKKDDVEKNILALSGGEAARLLLAKIALEQPNVMLLDEPTNHLDIEATTALIKALKNYTGTLLLVSHNRHFINEIVDRILFITHDHKIIDYTGRFIEFEATRLMAEIE